MTQEHIEDILSDMVMTPADQSIDQREHLARYLVGLEERLRKVELAVRHANNVAGCLANGIIPD